MVDHKYLFILIDVQTGFALPTALRSQAVDWSQGMRWHCASHHKRALSFCCTISLHYPFLLLLQLMDTQMKNSINPPLLLTSWSALFCTSSALMRMRRRDKDTLIKICICILCASVYTIIRWEKVIQVGWSKQANVCLPVSTLPVESDNLSGYLGMRNYQQIQL